MSNENGELFQRIEMLEKKVDMIFNHLDLEYKESATQEPPFMQEVRKLIAQNNKLMAIKIYVDNVRCDLKTAKDKIDSMA